MRAVNLVRFIQKHEISSQSKVKSFTRKLPCYTKVAEIPNYAILAMKELKVAFKTTLTLRRVNNKALKIKNHE